MLIAPMLSTTVAASPHIPGLANKHPLTEPQVGRLLLGELRCNACHGIPAPPTQRAAPDLADVGSRVSPEYLRKFLASPAAAHPGTTMPEMLAGVAGEERNKIAEALTHFLIARSPRRSTKDRSLEQDAAAGKDLFHTVGCVACHSPRDEAGKEMIRTGVVALEHVPRKYSPGSLAEFLLEPLRTRPSGRMPDMRLTPGEARSLASYLVGKAEAAAAMEPNAELAAQGKEHFRRLNCAACHTLDDIAPAPAVSALATADLTRGCLAEKAGKGPRYPLSESQTKAIRAALAAKSEPPAGKALLATTLTAFNCIACHVRDDYGGVSADLNPHFKTSEVNLGDEARIPPPLTLVGAKLQPLALKKMLFDGDSVRPYMFTRMPQFGESNLRTLPELFASLDSLPKVEFKLPPAEGRNEKDRTREKEMRAAGRELLGDKALYCIACHTFNGKAASFKGIELMISPQRLTPTWFTHYMRDPGAFRPRTVMPNSFEGGKSAVKHVLDGDADRQIEAMWYFLTLGTSAADPSGIRSAATKLEVTDAARTYRGRSSVAGYRGIAVGFPEKLSYAFNAETGTLTAVWRGDFVQVDRGGQGSGGFQPAGKPLMLAQDVSFMALKDERTPWPLRPVMTKEAPANPDPLYPKNHGYQFKGYELDDASIPTFFYRSGDVEIEDRASPAGPGKNDRLQRRLTFHAPADRTLWFRALTGKIEAEAKGQFKTGELRLGVPDVPTTLRAHSGDAKSQELLLRFDIPKGQSTRTLTYELLK